MNKFKGLLVKHNLQRFFPLCFLLLSGLVSAQSGNITVSSRTHWTTGILELDITAPIEEEINQPTGRYKTEQHIMQAFPLITGKVLQEITVDSSRDIGNLVQKDPSLLRRLENLSPKMTKVFTTATADRKFLTVRHTLQFFPYLAQLITDKNNFRQTPVDMGYCPNEDFTGLVIYAGEALPLQGRESEKKLLVPCLFPKLYSPDLQLIHCAEMTEPEKLRAWGNAAYSRDFDLGAWGERIGPYPLRLMARKIYGIKGTDLILSRDGIKKLLSSEHNRRLLKEGRVLIILPPKTPEPSTSSSP